MYDIICIHMTSHTLRYHTTLWHSHTLYKCHHTQHTCHRMHCSWAITYSVLITAHLQHVWYQTHYMHDIIWILCDITKNLYDIKGCTHDITSTHFKTSHPLYMTWYTLYLRHHSHCNYDKTSTMFLALYSGYMTSHMLNEGQHNDCIWYDAQSISIIKPTLLFCI